MQLRQESKEVLWACVEWVRQTARENPEQWICFRWICSIYQQRFGRDFHQSQLGMLAKGGLLRHDDLVRGGTRRYYRIADLPLAERVVGSL